MHEIICLQCKKVIEGPSSRLVQDTCGHTKCRVCLLQDENCCKQCTDLKNVNNNSESNEDTPVKLENKYAAVIMCNGNTTQHDIPQQQNSPLSVENNKNQKDKLKEPIKYSNIVKDENATKLKTKSKKKRAYNSINIPNHITVTLDPHLFHCNICNKSFSTKAHVKYHTYCAGAVKSHNCTICKKEFILKAQLDIHMYKHGQHKPYSCNICGKSFSEKSKLKRHSILHNSYKAHVCSECGKGFKTKESLRVHSIIHKGDKPYACKTCKAKFNNSSNLKKHLASHSNEKVHMCDQCGKRFKLKWALCVHQKSHLRIRQYECTVCNKSFVNNKDLQRHKLIHIDTKEYTCSICKTSFRRKDNLGRHIKNAHPGKKAEIIKTVAKPQTPRTTLMPVDNPNAIHVITASPAYSKIKQDSCIGKLDNRSATLINGPPKLAFKTPAFKNSYNIQRDFNVPTTQITKTYDIAESVDICQKILSPHTSIPRNVIQKLPEPTSTEICQKILEPYSTPIHYETSFQNRKHAMIKNIKFKVPIQYTINSKPEEPFKDIVPLAPVTIKDNSDSPIPTVRKASGESQPVSNAATSVIVNNQPNMHWRRRTSQTLNIKN